MKKIIIIAAAILMVATIANAKSKISICVPLFSPPSVVYVEPEYMPPPPPPPRHYYYRPVPPPPPLPFRHFHHPPQPPPPPPHHGGHHPQHHFKR